MEWLAGNRIRGTTAERPEYGLPSGSVGGWKELGRSTLSGTSQDLSVSSLPDKRYYMVLSDCIRTVSGTQYIQPDFRFNDDSGNNYSSRWSGNGGSEGTLTSYNRVHQGVTTDEGAMFQVSYISNLAGKEKLVIGHEGQPRLSGSTYVPSRAEWVGKWANTSDAIHTINTWESGTGSYASGSETVILGWDPDDTHTDNFFEELASVTASGSSTNLSSGTITAKKYLWIQAQYSKSSNGTLTTTFNNDTGSNYSFRKSTNGGSDSTFTSQASIAEGYSQSQIAFLNMFIINNTSNEKLVMAHTVLADGTGAGTAPTRIEYVGKWANTSNQITEIDLDSSGGNFDNHSMIKVWGAD